MSEFTLPILSESLREHKPKLSGACPLKAIPLMFLVPLPISLILGGAAHYLGIVIGNIAEFLASVPQYLGGGVIVVIAVLVLVCIGVLAAFIFYAIIVGAIGGSIVGQLSKKGHCRNPVVVGWAGFLNGIVIYLGHLLLTLRSSPGISPVTIGEFSPMTITIEMFEHLIDKGISGTPWWMIALVIIEFAIVVFSAIAIAYSNLVESNYCEAHGRWYTDWKENCFPINTAETIAKALHAQDAREIESIEHQDKKNFPHLIIKTRTCPSNQSCDIEIAGTLFWLEITTDKKGNTSQKQKSQLWFDVMMPAIFGSAFDQAIALENNTEKGK